MKRSHWPCRFCERKDSADGAGNCHGCGARRDKVEIMRIQQGYPKLMTLEFVKPRSE